MKIVSLQCRSNDPMREPFRLHLILYFVFFALFVVKLFFPPAALSMLSVKRTGRENFLDGEPTLGQPLLNRVVQQCL